MTDIVIIGAGTAGLTAAIYATRAGCSVEVLEKLSYGGQIINALEVQNYPGFENISGLDLSDRLYQQATSLGAKVRLCEWTGFAPQDDGSFVVATTEGDVPCRAVILATGSRNRLLGAPREQELTGRGVSYCATCDGAFFRGKRVAVVGGGNTALDDALYLADICEHVYLIHRRDSFRAEAAEVERAAGIPNVEFVLNATVKMLQGEPTLSGVVVNTPEGERLLAVSGLFVAVGREPENAIFAPPVQLDESGYIAAGEDCATNVPGVYCAGDCRQKTVRQLVTAAADGAVAALAAAGYAKEHK